MLSARTGSSNQNGSKGSRAFAIVSAAGMRHSPCSSTMMSMRLPTAARTLRNGSSACSRSSFEM